MSGEETEIQYSDRYILDGIGGETTVDLIATHFSKSLSQNTYLSQYFEDVDPMSRNHIQSQKTYLLYIITSTPLPAEMSSRMQAQHFKLGLDHGDFDKMLALYAEAFSKCKVQELLASICMDKIELNRNLIVSKPKRPSARPVSITSLPVNEFDGQLVKAIGGQAKIEAISVRVNQLMFDDDVLGVFFEEIPMEYQIQMLKKFLNLALNRNSIGPKMRKHMHKAHSKLKLNDTHFDMMKKFYMQAFQELGIAEESRTVLLNLIEGIREDLVYKVPVDKEGNEIDKMFTSSKPAAMMGLLTRQKSMTSDARNPFSDSGDVLNDGIKPVPKRRTSLTPTDIFNKNASKIDKPTPRAAPKRRSSVSVIICEEESSTPAPRNRSSTDGQYTSDAPIITLTPNYENDEDDEKKSEETKLERKISRTKPWGWSGGAGFTAEPAVPLVEEKSDSEKKKGKGIVGMIRGMSFKIQKAIDGTFNNNPSFDATTEYLDTTNENIAHGSSSLSPNVQIEERRSTKSLVPVHEKSSMELPSAENDTFDQSDSLSDSQELATSGMFKKLSIAARRNSTKEVINNIVERAVPKRRGSLSMRASISNAAKSGSILLGLSEPPTSTSSKSSVGSAQRRESLSVRASITSGAKSGSVLLGLPEPPTPLTKSPSTGSTQRRESSPRRASITNATNKSGVLPELPAPLVKSPSKSSVGSVPKLATSRQPSIHNKSSNILGRFASFGSMNSSRSNMELDKDATRGSISSFSKNPDDYIYENIGGEEGISKAIDNWAELLMKSDSLKSVFDHVDFVVMKALQRRFMMLVTTQHKLPVRDIEILMSFHSKLSLTDAHFNEMKDIYTSALITAGSMPLIADLALDRIEKTRDFFLGRYEFDEEVIDVVQQPIAPPLNYLIHPIQEMSIIGETVFADPLPDTSND